jgi:hypothetical protein
MSRIVARRDAIARASQGFAASQSGRGYGLDADGCFAYFASVDHWELSWS